MWAIAPDYDSIWEKGILTVDANMPLDLYRYNSDTCDSLLDAIGSFGERVWVSPQAASEFFANRKRVIVSAGQDFAAASRVVDGAGAPLADAAAKLRGFRLLPRGVIEQMEAAIAASLDAARKEIDHVGTGHPDYLKDDPILDRLLAAFDGRVGDGYDEGRRSELIREGQARFASYAIERAGGSLKPDIAQEIREVSARRARAHPPAVEVEHLRQVAPREESRGALQIEPPRGVRMMTGSGRLEPHMVGVPEVRATVTSAPSGCPPLDVRRATGTTFDFNVHVRRLRAAARSRSGITSCNTSASAQQKRD